jgi:hypothetical protein
MAGIVCKPCSVSASTQRVQPTEAIVDKLDDAATAGSSVFVISASGWADFVAASATRDASFSSSSSQVLSNVSSVIRKHHERTCGSTLSLLSEVAVEISSTPQDSSVPTVAF